MRQMIGGSGFTFGAGTNYSPPMGVYGIVLSDPWIGAQTFPTAGKFVEFRVKLFVAPGAGKSRTFDLYINYGASSGLSVTISDTNTTGYATGSLSISAGDYLTVRCVGSNTPANSNAAWSIVFDGDIEKESVILGVSNATGLSLSATRYCQIANNSTPTATENDCRVIIPTSGTIKKLHWRCGDPGTSPNGFRATVRKNGADTSLTADIIADNSYGSDVSNSFTVAGGDILTISFAPVGSPTNATMCHWGVVFLADVDGESVILSGSTDLLSTTGTEYHCLNGINTLQWREEYFYQTILSKCYFKNLYVTLSGSPYNNDVNADKYTFSLRVQSVDTGISLDIIDGGTGNYEGSDTSNIYFAGTDGYVPQLRVVPASTPTSRAAYWGIVSYMNAYTPETGGLGVSGAAPKMGLGIGVPSMKKLGT